MHENSMKLMEDFISKYHLQDSIVIDMGSQDINGSYKELFSPDKYIGADIVQGINVDVIVGSSVWHLIKNVDLIISGQTLEHVEDIEDFMASISEKLNSGGLICLIAPTEGPAHNYPIWAGNYSKERMEKVVKRAGFEIIDCSVSDVGPCFDCRCIARKPKKK